MDFQPTDGDEESDDSFDWGSSDSESSASSHDGDYADLLSKFLKKSTDKDDDEKKKKKERKGDKPRMPKKGRDDLDDELGGEWKTVKGGAQVERPKMFEKDQDINTAVVIKKLAEITAVRGKKVCII